MYIEDLIKALANDSDFRNPIIHTLQGELIRHNHLMFVTEKCLELARSEYDKVNGSIQEIELIPGDVDLAYGNPEYFGLVMRADELHVLIELLEEAQGKGGL